MTLKIVHGAATEEEVAALLLVMYAARARSAGPRTHHQPRQMSSWRAAAPRGSAANPRSWTA